MKQLFGIPLLIFFLTVTEDTQAQQSSLVLQRFYMIHRLHKLCSLALFSEPDHHGFKKLQEVLPLMKHPHIQRAMSEAIDTHSMHPLQQLWRLVRTYHFLDDLPFMQEFTLSLYMLFYDSFPVYKAHHVINDDLIAYRFYCIERLRHAVTHCTVHLFDDPSTKIMLLWWQEYVDYKHILEPAYTRGLCLLLIMLLAPSSASQDGTLYSHEQLFDLIDSLTDQISSLQKPSFYSKAAQLCKQWIASR